VSIFPNKTGKARCVFGGWAPEGDGDKLKGKRWDCRHYYQNLTTTFIKRKPTEVSGNPPMWRKKRSTFLRRGLMVKATNPLPETGKKGGT